jgi:hypothetical protein
MKESSTSSFDSSVSINCGLIEAYSKSRTCNRKGAHTFQSRISNSSNLYLTGPTMVGNDSRQPNAKLKTGRESRASKYGFLVVSLWSFLSIVSPGYTDAFQLSLHRKSHHTSHLFSSHQAEDDTWTAENARRRLDDYPSGRRRQKTKPMPLTGYDAQAIDEYYDRRPLQIGWRLNSLSFPLLGTFCSRFLEALFDEYFDSIETVFFRLVSWFVVG